MREKKREREGGREEEGHTEEKWQGDDGKSIGKVQWRWSGPNMTRPLSSTRPRQ